MEKIVLGLSGGADSFKALKILKEANFKIIALTLVFNKFSETDKKNIERSKKICREESVEHHILDVSDEFEKSVKKYFTEEYKNGKTPSPCIICNREIKFKYILNFADDMGIKLISTGHYADTYFNLKFNRFTLKKAIDKKKDQTYFLYRLPQSVLSRIIFPLGKVFKKKTENYSESQEICFVKNDYREFLRGVGISEKNGDIVYKDKIVGKHSGIWNFTIGQRRGLGVSLGKPVYVVKLDSKNNILFLGDKEDLFKKEFTVKNCNWILFEPESKFNCFIKIRSQFKEKRGKVKLIKKNRCIVTFDEPQSSITPGQSAVFYNEFEEVIGGGEITFNN